MKKNLLSLVMLAALQACGGGGSSPTPENGGVVDGGGTTQPTLTLAQKVAQMEESGELPKLERGDSLTGIDTNNNGIRDDIEAKKKKKYPQPEIQTAMLNSAAAYQKTLTADFTNKNLVRALAISSFRADSCIDEIVSNNNTDVDPIRLSKEIRAITTNTKKRMLASIDFGDSISGMVFSFERDGNCN